MIEKETKKPNAVSAAKAYDEAQRKKRQSSAARNRTAGPLPKQSFKEWDAPTPIGPIAKAFSWVIHSCDSTSAVCTPEQS